VNDIPFDIESLETHNTTPFVDALTRDMTIEDTGSRATPLEKNTAKENLAHTGETKRLTPP